MKLLGSNPKFLGVDATDGLVMGAGLFLTSFVKKKLIDPLAAKVGFLAKQTGIGHDLIDLGSAGASAFIASTGVGMVSQRFGRDVAAAGVAYTGAKALAIPFKGLGFDESIPQFFGNLRHNAMAGKTDQPALTVQQSQDIVPSVPTTSNVRSKVAI